MALALLLLGLAATAVAGPVNLRYTTQTICAGFCPENTKFGFENGKTYDYDYESIIKTHIPGASTDQSTLKMQAVVKLEVISRCEMALRLQGVELKDVAPGTNQVTSAHQSVEFATALQLNALRFAFVSGNVESICPGPEEETWVLNIKRGLLSHLQNTMNDFHVDFRSRETDVTGDCPVIYTTESAGWNGVHMIKKTKNIEGCMGRISAETVLQGTAYRTPSRMQSLPLMKGTQVCRQKINSQGVLVETACTESHLFRPFSKGNSGATTDITTKMTFKQEAVGVLTAQACGQAVPINFDHEKAAQILTNSKIEVERVLREMCAQTANGVSANTPSLFGKLVQELKKLDTMALLSLHNDINSGFCRHAVQFLHDAIPTLGTEASTRLIKNMILSGEIAGAKSTIWLSSLAFIQKPTIRMISEVAPLVSISPLNRQAALSISSLVNNFCTQTADCATIQIVRDIISALEVHLTRGCLKSATKHDEVMTALKALGNTGHGNAELLNMCVRNEAIAMTVRIAAVNAFRHMGCAVDKSELVRTFENAKWDPELRINAYLSLMVCPTTDILVRVRNVLKNEEVNQVGSFVWTHLTNLMETANPLKQEIRQVVEQESLRKAFNVDKRKFSRNVEKSYFSEVLNSGASVESNIIFSPESFIPRSACVNLTTDLFGHSVNLVEIGGRVEGLNGILDELFDTHAPVDEPKKTTAEINKIDKKVDWKKESMPQGSAYIRIFGNEIAYSDFHDLDASTVLEKFNYLKWLVELAKEHTIDFSKSFQFLDTNINVATITGLPLRMHVEGNVVTTIKLKGKIDLRHLVSSPRTLNIDGNIAPSAAMEIMAEMGVDAFTAKTGIRTVDTVHTSTLTDVTIQLREGRIFSMDVKMARDKMEVFSAKHDLFVVYRGKPQEMAMPASRFTYTKCIAGTFTTVTGLEICAEVAMPNEHATATGPYVPLTAPAHVVVVLNKRDTFSNYHFEAKALRERAGNANQMETVDMALLTFNTPGSRVNRELTMDFSLNYSQKKVSFILVTPWMPRVDISGAFKNTDVMKRATLNANIGTITYVALAEIEINVNKYNTRYVPKFELKMPNGINPTVSGTLLYRAGRKIDVNIVAKNVLREPVTIDGLITGISDAKKMRYETDLNVKAPSVHAKVTGFIDRTQSDGAVYSSRLDVVSKREGHPSNRLTFSSKIRNRNSAKKTERSGTIGLTSSMWPAYDTDAKFNIVQQGNTLSSSFEACLAGDERKTLKIVQNGLLNWNSYSQKASMKIDVTLPYMDMDYKLNIAHGNKKAHMQSSATLFKGEHQYGILAIDMSRESVSPLKAKADIKLEYPGRQMRYQQSIEEISKKHYKTDVSMQLQQDQVVVLTVDYKMLPHHELVARLTTPFTSPITLVGYLYPTLRNFQAKATIEHMTNHYVVEATMNLKANDKRMFIQFVHPSRTIITNAEMKMVGKITSGMFETKWDAMRNVDKKVSLTGEITLARMRPRLSIKAEMFPNKFMEVTTSGSFIRNGENWNNQGSFNLRSSCKNFEDISASIKHKKTPSEIIASGQVSWAPDRKIDGGFTLNLRSGWRSLDLNAKIVTPFVAVHRIIYQLDYAVEGNTFSANTKCIFNEHTIGFVMAGLTESQRTEGSMTMTSTIPQFEKLVLKVSHVDTGRKCHSDAELTWGNNKKIALVYNMEHARSGYHLTNNGDLQITTPFIGYKKTKIIWTHHNDESSIKHHSEIEIFKKTIICEFDASLNIVDNKRHLHINTILTGPNIDMKVNVEHEHNIDNIRGIKTIALVQWQVDKNIQITNEFNMDSRNLQASLKVISPIKGFETITIVLDNSIIENTITAKNEIMWPGKKISLNGVMTRVMYEYDGNFQLESPFMPTQKMIFSNKKQGTKYVGKHSYEYAPGAVVVLGTSYECGRTNFYAIDFSSPFELMHVVKFDIEHSGTYRNFAVKANFFHNLMADKVELDTRMDTANMNDMKIAFTLKTPILLLTNLHVMYNHKLQGRDFHCSGILEIPFYRATFNHEMTFMSWNQFNTKTIVMLKPGQKIELITQFQHTRVTIAAITFRSPFFNDMEEVAVSIRREWPRNTFDVSVDKVKKFTGVFEFAAVEGMQTSIQLTTPFRGYKSIGCNINYKGQLTDMKIDWILHCENERIAGHATFALKEQQINLHSTLTTPFPGYENIVLTFNKEGRLYQYNCKGLFEFPGKKFTIENNFALTSAGLNVKVDIRTPFRILQVFNIEIMHEGMLKNFKNSALFIMNQNKYEANSHFKLIGKSVSGNVALILPEEYSILFTHERDDRNFNNKMLLKYASDQICVENTLKHQSNNWEGFYKVLIQFTDREKFTFIGNHHGPLTNFHCDYAIELGAKRLTVNNQFKMIGNELAVKLDIDTPFHTIRNMNVEFNHAGPVTGFKNGGYVQINHNKYAVASEFAHTARSINLQVIANLPKVYSLTIRHQGTLNDFNNNFEVKAGSMVINGMTELKMNNGIEMAWTLNTPFHKMRNVVFKLSHKGALNNFEQQITLMHGMRAYTNRLKFEKTANEIHLRYEMKTPLEALRTLVVEANHIGMNIRNFRSNIDIIHNNQKRAAGIDCKWANNVLKLKVIAHILEDYTLLLTHKVGNRMFNTDLKIRMPTSNIDGTCTFEITDNVITGSLVLTTPFVHFKSQDIMFENKKIASGFVTKLNMHTSLPGWKSMEAILNHVGTYKDFTTTGKIDLDAHKMTLSIVHRGDWFDFSSSSMITLNGKGINGELAFKKNGVTIISSGTLITPAVGFEKMTFNINHEGQVKDFISTFSMALNNKVITGKVTSKKMENKLDTLISLTTPFEQCEKIVVNLNHQGYMTDFTSMMAVVVNDQAVNGQVTCKKTDNKIGITGSITTPIAGYEEITFVVQGHMSADTSRAMVKITGQAASFKVVFEKTGNTITASCLVMTPFADFEKISFNLNTQCVMTDFASSVSMTINEDTIGGQVAFKKVAEGLTMSLTVFTPIAGYDRISIAFEGRVSAPDTHISMTINGQPVTMELLFEKSERHIKSSGTLTAHFAGNEHFGFNFNHEGSLKNFHTILSIETPNKIYDHFGVDIRCDVAPNGIKFAMEIETPFEGYRTLAVTINHGGNYKDFRTVGSVIGPMKSIKFELAHKGEWSAFNTECTIDINSEKYPRVFVNVHSSRHSNGNIDASGTLDLPRLGQYSCNVKNIKTAHGFATEASLQTPHRIIQQASFDLTHDRIISNFGAFERTSTFTADGSYNGFTSSAGVAWNNMRIHGKTEFKKEEGNLEASMTLITSFKGWEKLHADIKHSKQVKKIRTEVNIETPFQQIRNPSFVIDHRGHWKNFKTMMSIATPFKTIQPITINVNHRGTLRDFTTSGNIRYGMNNLATNAKYQRTANGFVVSADMSTPFKNIEEIGFNIQCSRDGNRVQMKGALKTPDPIYKHFSMEVNHEGNMRKWDTTGKMDTPFTNVVVFEMHHNGVPTDFESRGFIECQNGRTNWEAQFHKTGMSLEGFAKIITPYSCVRTLEVIMAHSQENNREITGNVKAAYNTDIMEADYRLTKVAKTIIITMDTTGVVNRNAAMGDAFSHLNTNASDKRLRIEGTLKNTNADRQVTLVATWPHHIRKVTAGYQKTDQKIAGLIEIQSDSTKLQQKVELAKVVRGREVIFDGIFKTASPMITFEVNGNQKVNPGRRYLTEINIITTETLMLRSDIRTPGGLADFTTNILIAHPSFSKGIVIDVQGKIDVARNLYDCKIDMEYANEKISYMAKIADESNRYRTKWIVMSSLKHPNNNIDVTFETMVLNNRKNFNINSKCIYMMSASRKLNTMSAMVDVNKATEEVKINVATPVKNFDLRACRTINEVAHQHFTVWCSLDGRNMNAEVDMDRTIPSFSSSLHYGPEKSLHMYAKYISADHFKMEAYSQVSGHNFPEASIDTEIVNGHLLRGRFFLRPSILNDVSSILNMNFGLGQLVNDIMDVVVNDVRLKIDGFKREIDLILQTLETVNRNLQDVVRRTKKLLDENLFYTKDIVVAMLDMCRNMYAKVNGVVTRTIEGIRRLKHMCKEAVNKCNEWSRMVLVKCNNWYKQVVAKMVEWRVELHKKIVICMDKMLGGLIDLANAIYNYPIVQTLITVVRARGERIIERMIWLTNKLMVIVDHLLVHPKLTFIRERITDVKEKIVWIFEQVDIKMWVYEWLHHMEAGLAPLRHATWMYIRDMLHLDETRINTWAPNRGEIAAQVYVPLLMRDLYSIPTINIHGFLERMRSRIPDTDWVFWDTLYAYMPSSDIRNWIPPFKAHATIAGNQHYMTFDKKFYEFAGECSYLLARDFIDGTFSVIVNYEKHGSVATKKSLTIVHGTNQVEIMPDFRVEMNGRRIELPIISEHTAVYRVGNTLRIDNDHGIKITCNLAHDHCTVAVSGWYFGKTAGLLGTYDNEPSTDFIKMNGHPAKTIEEFAHSWIAGKTCRAANHAMQQDVSPAHPKYDACAAIFQAQTSAFRPCFKQRDPAPFMRMCLNGDTCKVASFYVTECNMIEVPMRMLRQCVTCQLPSGIPLSEGEEHTIRNNEVPKKADVIFVMSHGQCNQQVIPKILKLVNQVMSGMKEHGVADVQFGIVGYGGEGIATRAFSHTMDGHLLNTKPTFLRTMSKFRTMDFNNVHEDALTAINFASHYNFRAGASKSIVLMPCHKCSTEKISYSTIQTVLSEKDIKFHLMMQEDFKIKGNMNSPKTNFMYGIDRTSVFTAKDARGKWAVGDTELRHHTLVPKGLCIALTHETDGTVFNLLKLTETKPAMQKRFATVVGRVIAKKGLPATCQHCECRSDESGVGVTVCYPCAPVTQHVYTWDSAMLPKPEVPFAKSRLM